MFHEQLLCSPAIRILLKYHRLFFNIIFKNLRAVGYYVVKNEILGFVIASHTHLRTPSLQYRPQKIKKSTNDNESVHP